MKNTLKNLGVFLLMSVLLTLLILAVDSATATAQKSTILIGDKNNSEVKGSAQNFKDLISDIDYQMRDLEKENTKKIDNLERSKKRMLHNPGQNQYLIEKTDYLIKHCQARTDSLLAVYQQNKSNLEDELANFIVKAAGKDEQETYNLQSRDLSKITDAMYALDYIKRKKSINKDVTADVDSAFIDNGWYKKVFVTISGLNGRFHQSFPLDGKSTATIPIPGPGNYIVYYDFGNEIKCVPKRFDGHNFDFNPKTKKQYAFISGLPNTL